MRDRLEKKVKSSMARIAISYWEEGSYHVILKKKKDYA